MKECRMDMGFLLPSGEMIKLENWKQYYQENKEIVGKEWWQIYDYIKESDIGLIIDCAGNQSFLSISDIKPREPTREEIREKLKKSQKDVMTTRTFERGSAEATA